MPNRDHESSPLGAVLRSAIQQALLTPEPKIPSGSELVEISKDAYECIQALRCSLARMDTSRLEARRRVAHTLFLAGVSYSEAMTFILAAAPRDLSVAALSLHRPSLESCFRGAFVGYTASDEQAADVIENGVPRTRTQSGKWRSLSMKELAGQFDEVTRSTNASPSRLSMTQIIERDGEIFHGFVHAGNEMVNLYDNGGLPPEGYLDMLRMAMSGAMSSVCLAGGLTRPSEEEFRSAFVQALDQALGFFDRLDDFKRRHGIY